MALVTLAAVAATPLARAGVPEGVYLGLNAGRSQLSYDTSVYPGQVAALGDESGTVDYTRWSRHRRADAWCADVGYMATRHFGLELSYLHLGELTYRVSGSYTPFGRPVEHIVVTTGLSSRGPALAGVMRLPLTETVSVYGKVGDYYARTTLDSGLDVTRYEVTRTRSSGSSLLLGAGAQYTFAGHWSAHLDYLRVNQAGQTATGKYNADVLTLGASYTF